MVENRLYFRKGITTEAGTMGILPEVGVTKGPLSVLQGLPHCQISVVLNCSVQLTGKVVKALGRLFPCKQICPPHPDSLHLGNAARGCFYYGCHFAQSGFISIIKI